MSTFIKHFLTYEIEFPLYDNTSTFASMFTAPGQLLLDRPEENGQMGKLWERGVEVLYQVIEDFTDLTRPLKEDPVPIQPLTVKT